MGEELHGNFSDIGWKQIMNLQLEPHNSYAEVPGTASGCSGTTKEAARAWAYGQDRARARDPGPSRLFCGS